MDSGQAVVGRRSPLVVDADEEAVEGFGDAFGVPCEGEVPTEDREDGEYILEGRGRAFHFLGSNEGDDFRLVSIRRNL